MRSAERTETLWINGGWRAGSGAGEAVNPYTNEMARRYSVASEADVEDAIAASGRAFPALRGLPTYRRAELLLGLRDAVAADREIFAHAITLEAGKPITDARVEVDRALNVLTLSAEEAKRLHGETFPLDLIPGSENRFGLTRRFPVGPLAAITPYNFPLNLALHKIGPALAVGNPVVWKPSLLAPGAAILFAERFAALAARLDIPPGALNVITPPDALAERLATDARLKMLSFTGSARVGWKLRALAGAKRVTLELGGNAAVVIGADADLDYAVRRCVVGGFGYAGQTCISVQRILVEADLYAAFMARFVPAVWALRAGDPLDPNTQVGPMVSEREASRVETWIAEAVAGGATPVVGGARQGLMVAPTVLTDTRPEMQIESGEAFGPVVTVAPFTDWSQALATVNASPYGLQTGLFTHHMGRIFEAFETLEVGGVIVNDVPTYRMDSMPYGGVKQSGVGREGVRYAMEEMTEIRLLAFNLNSGASPPQTLPPQALPRPAG